MKHRVIGFGIIALLIAALFLGAKGIITDNNNDNFPEPEVRIVTNTSGEDENMDLPKNYSILKKQKGYTYAEAERITYHSKVTGGEKHAKVLLPVDYDSNKKYPVLYLLHGYGGSDQTWLNKDADIILQNLHYMENTPEMVVVFPNCIVSDTEDADDMSFWETVPLFDRTEQELVESLMPYINEHYFVYTDKDHTAIAGNSMGGRNALYTSFSHQDLFGYVGAFSAANVLPSSYGIELLDHFELDKDQDGFRLLFLNVGREDDTCGESTYQIDEDMKQNQIPHITYDMNGRHENVVWQNALYNFGKRIFQ